MQTERTLPPPSCYAELRNFTRLSEVARGRPGCWRSPTSSSRLPGASCASSAGQGSRRCRTISLRGGVRPPVPPAQFARQRPCRRRRDAARASSAPMLASAGRPTTACRRRCRARHAPRRDGVRHGRAARRAAVRRLRRPVSLARGAGAPRAHRRNRDFAAGDEGARRGGARRSARRSCRRSSCQARRRSRSTAWCWRPGWTLPSELAASRIAWASASGGCAPETPACGRG